MAKLSVVISAFNEQKKIKACLESAKFADEIIFVDNSSTDKTVKIAKEYTKKVYIQKNEPTKIDLQKNLGIQKSTGDWIFILDADEVISPELAKEIKLLLKEDKIDFNGFWIPRKNTIFGKWIQYSGWYPDPQLRLFKKGKGKYEKSHYHEPIAVTGATGRLSEHLIHYNYEHIGQFLYKNLQVYAVNEAEDLLRKGYIFSYGDAIRLPIKEFLSRYFAREGYKDGFHGLMLAILMAIYHFVIFAYIWEQKKFADEAKQSLKDFEKEAKEAGHELKYWINKIKIDEEKFLFKKMGLKVKRKLHL
ncbi:glycosyltransferase family 2 protein [Candidatus Roizmanbacteria bacterium]|nr:glycosyltransferase family 2 protein [Candidatus Roizmanbacteria bacterium]